MRAANRRVNRPDHFSACAITLVAAVVALPLLRADDHHRPPLSNNRRSTGSSADETNRTGQKEIVTGRRLSVPAVSEKVAQRPVGLGALTATFNSRLTRASHES
jgi:hypothetical protein